MIAAPTPRTGRTSARARDAAATVQCPARRARGGFASLPGRGIADRRAGLEGAETPPPHVGGARYVQIWAGSAYVGQGPISPRLGLACLSLHLPLRIFIASSPSPSSRPSSFCRSTSRGSDRLSRVCCCSRTPIHSLCLPQPQENFSQNGCSRMLQLWWL